MQFGILSILAALPSFAGAWNGFLVNAACYASEQDNANKYATTTDRDMGRVVQYCVVNAKTTNFALVLADWSAIKLVPAQSRSLSQVARSAPKRGALEVTVTRRPHRRFDHRANHRGANVIATQATRRYGSSNAASAGPTGGTVTVTEILSSGLVLVSEQRLHAGGFFDLFCLL